MRLSEIFKKYMPDLSLADMVSIDRAFVEPTQFSRGGTETIRAGNVVVGPSDGTTLFNPNTGKRSIYLDPDGDAFFGSNIDNPPETSFAIFSNEQGYNTEDMGAGDVLLGDNSSGSANLQWDRSTGRLNFRIGETVYVYVDTAGGVKVGSGIVLDGQAQVIRSDNYVAGRTGFQIDAVAGDAEFNNLIARGEFRTASFVYGEVQVYGGYQIITPKASTVFESFGVPSAIGGTVSAKIRNSNGTTIFAVNDIVRLKTYISGAGKDSWLVVTAVGTNSGEYTTYTLRLDSGSASWSAMAGLAVAGWGTTTSGGNIQLRADEATGSPNISIYTHAGAPWTTQTLRFRAGNMYNQYGTGANNRYGVGIGDYSGGNYLSYNAETADTFVISGGGGKVRLTGSGLQVLTSASLHTGQNAVDWFPSWGGALASTIWAAQGAGFNELDIETEPVTGKSSSLNIRADAASGYAATVQLDAAGGGDTATVRIEGTSTGIAEIGMQGDFVWIGTDSGLKVGATEGSGGGSGNVWAEGDIFTVSWTPYQDTSTIVGWSSFTQKQIRYKRVGKLMFVEFNFVGTSDSTTTSFTLPNANNSVTSKHIPTRISDNGGTYAWGLGTFAQSSTTVNLYPTPNGGAWTASGTKACLGEFFYEIA